MTSDPVDRRDLARLVLAAMCWGLGTVISKAAVAEVSPFVLLPLQLGASLVVLAVLIRRAGRWSSIAWSSGIARLGLLNPGIAYALSLVGLLTIGASLSVVLWVLEPLVIVLLATLVLGERPTVRMLGLSLVALVGVGLAVLAPSPGTGALIGVVLTIAGVLCCAVYTVIARRLLPGTTETGEIVFAQQAYALGLALVLVVVATAAGAAGSPASLSAAGLASAVVSGVLYYAAAYWAYLGALRRLPASLASASFYLIPIVGITASALLLGERLDPSQWIGVVLVIGSVIGISFVPPSSVEPSAEPAVETSLT